MSVRTKLMEAVVGCLLAIGVTPMAEAQKF